MLFWYQTRRGTFYIRPHNGGWGIYLEDNGLDAPFPTPNQAAAELANGHCASPGFDPSRLSIPSNIAEWNWVP